MPEPSQLWRLIDSPPGDAAWNMALDEALLHLSTAPVLRLYGWRQYGVTLGAFQRSSEIAGEYCMAEGITIVRRPTGGRAILHEPGERELTYCLSARHDAEGLGRDLFTSYERISRAFMQAFISLGFSVEVVHRKRQHGAQRSPLCFESTSYAEMRIAGRKVIGSAQHRTKTGMLQQGSIPLRVDHERQARVFGISEGDAVLHQLPGLGAFDAGLTLQILKQAVVQGFQQEFQMVFQLSEATQEELLLAHRLSDEKYADKGWTHRR